MSSALIWLWVALIVQASIEDSYVLGCCYNEWSTWFGYQLHIHVVPTSDQSHYTQVPLLTVSYSCMYGGPN